MTQPVASAHGHSDSVTTLTLSDHCLASGGDDGYIYFWSLNEYPNPLYRTPKLGPCTTAKFHPLNPNYLYSAHDSCIYTWDVRYLGAPLSKWNVNEDEVNSIDILANEERLAAADDSGTVQIINMTNGNVVRSLKKHSSICSVAKFRPNRTWQLITGGLDCRMIISDWKGTGLGVVVFELSELENSLLHESNRPISSHSSHDTSGSLGSEESEDDEECSPQGSTSSLSGLPHDRFSDMRSEDPNEPDGTLPVQECVISDESAQVQSSNLVGSDAWSLGIPVNPPMLHSLACSRSGDFVAAGLEKSTVELFVGEGKRLTHLRSLCAHRRAVSALHFIEDNCLISGGNDCNLFLWNFGLDARPHRLAHDAKVNAIEGTELQKVFVADCSPVIQLFDFSVF